MEGQRLQQRGAGSRQLRTARAQCKVHSGAVDPRRWAEQVFFEASPAQTVEPKAREADSCLSETLMSARPRLDKRACTGANMRPIDRCASNSIVWQC